MEQRSTTHIDSDADPVSTRQGNLRVARPESRSRSYRDIRTVPGCE
jgi:hypothetical protein